MLADCDHPGHVLFLPGMRVVFARTTERAFKCIYMHFVHFCIHSHSAALSAPMHFCPFISMHKHLCPDAFALVLYICVHFLVVHTSAFSETHFHAFGTHLVPNAYTTDCIQYNFSAWHHALHFARTAFWTLCIQIAFSVRCMRTAVHKM